MMGMIGLFFGFFLFILFQ